MAFMTWDEIRAATGGRLLLGKMRGNDAFAGITTDTRKVQAGDLFVALRGEKFDGADFAAGALRAGAVAVARFGRASQGTRPHVGGGDRRARYARRISADRPCLADEVRYPRCCRHGFERQDDDEGADGGGALRARRGVPYGGELQQRNRTA